MKRLIDVGDMTVVVEELLEAVTEQEEDIEVEWGMGKKTSIPLNDYELEDTPRQDTVYMDDNETPTQRAPFTDITPEATPIARKKMYRRDAIESTSIIPAQTSPGITRAPPGSPLASIINAINFSTSDQLPQISISSPPRELSSSTAQLVPSNTYALLSRTAEPSLPLSCSTAHLVPSTTSALLTHVPLSESICRPLSPPCLYPPPPMPQSPTRSRTPSPVKAHETAANDAVSLRSCSRTPSPKKTNGTLNTRPASVDIDIDLHSSFNFHLRDSESSFDLLNDKISFFGLDSSMAGPGMGMESSMIEHVGRAEVNSLNLTMDSFDVKDEEGRMRAFLGMSAGWEDGTAAKDEGASSPIRVVESAAPSLQNSKFSRFLVFFFQ